jgi:phenylpyruvate tautomerase PptA (4-oxalocrotonate tautomerase family)
VAKLSEAVTESLKLPLDRVFVRIEDIAARDWGLNGKTFA